MTTTVGTPDPHPVEPQLRPARQVDVGTLITLPERHPVIWVVGSALLGLVLYQSSMLSTLHAGLVLTVALTLALVGRRLSSIMVVLAYGVMSEVVWRATSSRAPWESGKYLLIVVALVSLGRFVARPRRSLAPVGMLLALVPGALVALANQPIGRARDGISFALLGPIGLGLGTLLCRQIVLDRREMRGLLWWALSPCVSMGAIAGWNTFTADTIEFGNESLFLTSGGFGPNQVSTVLGLGALLAVGIVVLRAPTRAQVVVAVVAVGLVAQALITLSRGGVYAAGLGALTMMAVLLVLGGNRSRGLLVLVAGGLLVMLALSWAQAFSGGAVENRFSQDDSGRGRIVSGEVQLFEEHPTIGVGAGRAVDLRQTEGLTGERASHNEYSRLLAEHGLFGLVVIGLVGLIAVQSFVSGTEPAHRALTAGLAVWSAATMSHSATRLAAVGLIFALACLRIESDAAPSDNPGAGPRWR